MDNLNTIWQKVNRSINVTGSSICAYPICYTTDLQAELTGGNLIRKTVCASGSDADKDVSVMKALMELVERIVFLKKAKEIYSATGNKVSTKALACDSDPGRARRHATLEFYEKYIFENLETLIEQSKTASQERLLDGDFNFSILKVEEVYFALVWFVKNKFYVFGTACSYKSEEAYKKALQEAYVKLEANMFECDRFLLQGFLPGYFEIDSLLPHKNIEFLQDELLDKLGLHMCRVFECERILH